jgi:radical S-adenosyl methionine domain-containing protein 2
MLDGEGSNRVLTAAEATCAQQPAREGGETSDPRCGARMPPSVNYHLWEPCNMRCRFCFATFQDVVAEVLPRGHLDRSESTRLVAELALHFQKITFAGGEPTLCPWLGDLIRGAKERGMTTMVVTNGSRLGSGSMDLDALAGHLDWIALSIDSASPATHVELGRAVRGKAIATAQYVALGERIRSAGIRLKLNTVVTAVNAHEDLHALVAALRPERWKILRVLPVEGQNSGSVEPLLCSDEAFQGFVARHRRVADDGVVLAPEDNDDIRGSYAMIDPAGRFFDDVEGRHRYTEPILAAGLARAWSQVRFSGERFDRRGGNYDFRRPR